MTDAWSSPSTTDMTDEDLRPCRSPYCECEPRACTHPGCYDARHEPVPAPTPPPRDLDPTAEWNGA
jgi:hypothetical protein